MLRYITRNLLTKMVTLFLVVSLVPIVTLGSICYNNGRAALEKQFFDDFSAIGVRTTRALIEYLRAEKALVETMAADDYLVKSLAALAQPGADRKSLQMQLSDYIREVKMPTDLNAEDVIILDMQGRIVGDSEKDHLDSDLSGEPFFREGLRGSYIQDVYFSREINGLTITNSAPILSHREKKTVGVIAVRNNLSLINEIMTNSTGLGETGEIIIVNKDKFLITPSRFLPDAALKQKADTEPVRQFQSKKENMTGIFLDYRDVPIVAALVGEALEREFGLGWTIVTKMDTDEAFVPSRELAYKIIWLGIAIAIVVAVVAYFFGRAIARPIKEVADLTVKAAEGDLNMMIPQYQQQDEIGVMLQSFSSLIKSLRSTAGIADTIAAGDLTVTVTPRSEKDTLGNALSQMVSSLTSQITELREAADVLASAASEILTSTTQLTASTTESATAVNQTSSTVEEVKKTSHLSHQKATYVSETAQQAVEVSENGMVATQSSMRGMDHIKEQMEAIAETVIKLSEQSQTIGLIITTVNDLAEQSNLLSVNASIEAAKAGEQGKGFAVVAQEIRNLAEQSKQATAQVQSVLNDIQQATSAAVMATEQGSKAVDAGVEQSATAGEAIRKLAENIQEAAQAAGQITASSQQQLMGMDQIASAMENIKQATSQNVASMGQVETSSLSLNELGQKLKELVGKYRM